MVLKCSDFKNAEKMPKKLEEKLVCVFYSNKTLQSSVFLPKKVCKNNKFLCSVWRPIIFI